MYYMKCLCRFCFNSCICRMRVIKVPTTEVCCKDQMCSYRESPWCNTCCRASRCQRWMLLVSILRPLYHISFDACHNPTIEQVTANSNWVTIGCRQRNWKLRNCKKLSSKKVAVLLKKMWKEGKGLTEVQLRWNTYLQKVTECETPLRPLIL